MPMILLVIIENILLIGAISGSRLLSYVENKEKAIFYEKVSNRKNYLENEMLTRWSNVNSTVEEINNTAQRLINTKKISLKTLDDSSEDCLPLLKKTSSKLINLIRTNQVTGAFVVLNTDNLEAKKETGVFENKPGIYLRDFDPLSTPSKKNEDLLFKYAPKALTQSMNISHGKTWRPLFEFQKTGNYGAYLYEPFQAALKESNPEEIELEDFGYWSMPYRLYDDSLDVISYSVPLILKDGTIYGVLGVEISLDYLQKQLPNSELIDNEQGSYLLGVENGEAGNFQNILINGMIYSQAAGNQKTTQILQKDEDYVVKNQDKDKLMYADTEYIDLYGENTEFTNQKWALIGIVPKDKLLVFSDRIIKTLIGSILISLLIGIAGAIIISSTISRPVARLIQHVKRIRPSEEMQFIQTGIEEVDHLSQALKNMNEEVVDTARRFSRIINMASVELAGFEINRKEGTVYFTGKFVEMFRLEKESFLDITSIEMFETLMKRLKQYEVEWQIAKENEVIYLIPDEKPHYLRLTLNDTGDYCSGLVENVTDMIMEKEQIEYERDHDPLTGLLNRRGFYRIMRHLFWQGKSTLKLAALVMIDLDDLKYVNDTYGHEYGDKYIKSAAEVFMRSVPEGTVVSRPGGDEFYILFYGYLSRLEIQEKLYRLQKDVRKQYISLPDGEPFALCLSAGVVWYPEDTTEMEEFMQYADFAMYQVKHTVKNHFGYFDKEAYRTSQEQYNEEKS